MLRDDRLHVHRPNHDGGFTLVEMLMVIVTITLLAGLMVPRLEDSLGTSRDARRKADIKSLVHALESYKKANGSYPDTSGQWRGDAPNFGGHNYGLAGWIPGLVPNHMLALPRDPDTAYPDGDNGYLYRSDGTDYKISAYGVAGNVGAGDPYYDPQHPDDTYSYATPGAYFWQVNGASGGGGGGGGGGGMSGGGMSGGALGGGGLQNP